MRPSKIYSSDGRGSLAGSWVVWITCLLLVLILGSTAVQAQEDEELDQGKVYAIQTRTYRMNHEFSVGLAFLPLDAFYKYISLSGHYVLHFSDIWAWEAIHFTFSQYLDIDTGLKKEMNNNWDVDATDTPRLWYTLDTNMMLKPLYGKMVLFDSFVINLESYFLAGIGAERFETSWFPCADIGVGMRAYLTDALSFRAEVREYLYFGSDGVDSVLYFGLGLSYNAFAEDRKVEDSKEGDIWKQ